MKTLITATILTLLALPSYAQLDDDFRQKQLDDINKADGIKSFLGVKRPIRLENGIDNHGWLYNKKLDVAIIQYTYSGQLYDSYKKQLAQNLLNKWKGEVGVMFRKWGFKDIAVMVTEGVETTIYSSKYRKWFTSDQYLAQNF